jgi:hypothetical protein
MLAAYTDNLDKTHGLEKSTDIYLIKPIDHASRGSGDLNKTPLFKIVHVVGRSSLTDCIVSSTGFAPYAIGLPW